MGLDIITVAIVTGIAFGHLFLESQIVFSLVLIPSFLYLAFDTIAITVVITVLVSSRRSQFWDRGLLTILVALLAYMTADGLYVSGIFNQNYRSNGVVDWLFIVSLIMLSSGVKISFFEASLTQSNTTNAESAQYNEGPFWSAAWILLLPVLSAILHGVHFQIILYYAFILIFYLVASLYVQNSISVEKMLTERTVHNTSLQVLVSERTAQLQTINHMIQYDQLTGLLSRNRFLQIMASAIDQRKNPWPVHLAVVDIARFRNINNLYGHSVGDQILVQTANRLSVTVGQQASVARLGGNEFAVLFHEVSEFETVQAELVKLFLAFVEPIAINSFQIRLQIQVGLASYPNNAKDQDELMQCALVATEQAKRLKITGPFIYDKTIHQQIQRRQEIEMALRRVEMDREFSLFYQPQYSVGGDLLAGMEALVRWDCVSLPGIGPGEFIGVAEETGKILEIGRWVMKQAMLQIREWNILYRSTYQMGINISPLQIEDPNFLESVLHAIQETGVKPEWLNFEITESAAMGTQEHFGSILKALSDLGASVSIDDFGTGYSSYAYLKRYAVDFLKIDKALIDTLGEVSGDAQIVQAIIAMAKALNIKTVAEGVESAEQAKLLAAMGCDKIQGYVYGRPVSAAKFADLHLSGVRP